MTITEMITKFGLKLAERNGIKGFIVTKGRANASQLEELKSNKPAIMIELEKIETEKRAQMEENKRRAEIEQEKRKAEYIKNANLKRYLVCERNDMAVSWYIDTLEVDGNRAYRAQYRADKLVELKEVTETMRAYFDNENYVSYGFDGMAWEVTENEEKAITEESEKQAETNRIEREKQAEIKKEGKEAERKTIFDKARITGEKQVLNHWTDECNDPNEDCSLDIIYQYAMPDGSITEVRSHTW